MAKKKKHKYKGREEVRKSKRAIVRLVRGGKRGYQAARQVGITQECFRQWKFLDKTFLTDIGVARERFLEDLVKSVKTGAKKDPYLALKVLERQDRENWADVQRIETKQDVKISDKRNEDNDAVQELGRLLGGRSQSNGPGGPWNSGNGTSRN